MRLLAIVLLLAAFAPAPPSAVTARAVFINQAHDLRVALDGLDSAAAAKPADSAQLRTAFRSARAAYKAAEWWIAADSLAAAAFDAPVNEVDDDPDDPGDAADARAHGIQLTTPIGLQAAEAMLYPAMARDVRWPMHDALSPARSMLRQLVLDDRWTDAAVFDAARDELARVERVSLADVDSPLARAGLPEGAASLDGLADALATYPSSVTVDSILRHGAALMRAARSDGAFDRFAFLMTVALPAGRALAVAREALHIPTTSRRSLWRASAATVVDSGALDAWAFAPADAPAPNPAEIALGRALFSERELGGASGRSCASCHEPARAFTDGLRHTHGRVTPTLIGAALEPVLFDDARVPTLEDQITEVIANREEMSGLPVDSIARRLAGRPTMVSQFAAAFHAPASPDAVTAARVRWALAAYERTLVRLTSPFDRALRGDTTGFSAEARRGFTVFMGRARCGSCHTFPLFGGTAEVEVIGTPRTADTAHAIIDPDLGRYSVTHRISERYAFRVPTVRNTALTGPYMHNGVYRTLDDVITFYNRGGGYGVGIRGITQTLPTTPLHLTTIERRELIAFLRSLTD